VSSNSNTASTPAAGLNLDTDSIPTVRALTYPLTQFPLESIIATTVGGADGKDLACFDILELARLFGHG